MMNSMCQVLRAVVEEVQEAVVQEEEVEEGEVVDKVQRVTVAEEEEINISTPTPAALAMSRTDTTLPKNIPS
jgi:hypothetical protein